MTTNFPVGLVLCGGPSVALSDLCQAWHVHYVVGSTWPVIALPNVACIGLARRGHLEPCQAWRVRFGQAWPVVIGLIVLFAFIREDCVLHSLFRQFIDLEEINRGSRITPKCQLLVSLWTLYVVLE